MRVGPKYIQLSSDGLSFVDVTNGQKTLFVVASEKIYGACTSGSSNVTKTQTVRVMLIKEVAPQ